MSDLFFKKSLKKICMLLRKNQVYMICKIRFIKQLCLFFHNNEFFLCENENIKENDLLYDSTNVHS